ncbi:hypothetical protein B0H63DRAFT_489128 [Podospora didyma]|uniref:Uncharacterized protein n=1 Tax=Podospora didyma TaxID=330526 RepID=A0AAE0K3G9_9PEZI|nr:hypothetical protein B0H63DRAFT_489128 [Podospora didyma]
MDFLSSSICLCCFQHDQQATGLQVNMLGVSVLSGIRFCMGGYMGWVNCKDGCFRKEKLGDKHRLWLSSLHSVCFIPLGFAVISMSLICHEF